MNISRLLSVAPMMERTDRHCRYFFRLLSQQTLLYSEMINANAITKGNKTRLLNFSEIEHPLALQIGGSDPKLLAEATKIGVDWGYDEINLNVGCPSSRVSSGDFGAVLMKRKDHVAKCVDAMAQFSSNVPISVKCRIAVDDQDPEKILPSFIKTVSNSGVSIFIIHARKAILSGLSPKDNRKIPPIDYNLVKKIKTQFPQLEICLNGEIKDLSAVMNFINDGINGCMIGREVYKNPSKILENADEKIFKKMDLFGKSKKRTLYEALLKMIPYLEIHLQKGGKASSVLRHLINSVSGLEGAKLFRSTLSENMNKKNQPEIFEKALKLVNFTDKKTDVEGTQFESGLV